MAAQAGLRDAARPGGIFDKDSGRTVEEIRDKDGGLKSLCENWKMKASAAKAALIMWALCRG